MYMLINEDIIMAAGGPMGSPIEERYRKHFNELNNAKLHAEKEYGKGIQWKEQDGRWTSGDLGHTEYVIVPVSTED